MSEAEFVAAQDIRATRPTKDGSRRRYVLSGLLRCALCGRRLDAHWVHGRAGYRCRHGFSSASARRPRGPRYLYVREDILVADLRARLASNHGRAEVNIDLAAIVSRLHDAGTVVVVHDGARWSLAPASDVAASAAG